MYFWGFLGLSFFPLKLFYIHYRPTPTKPFSIIIIIIQQDIQAISYYILKTSRTIVQQGHMPKGSYHLGMSIMFHVI